MTKVKLEKKINLAIRIMIICFLIFLKMNDIESSSVQKLKTLKKKSFFNNRHLQTTDSNRQIKSISVCLLSKLHRNRYLIVTTPRIGETEIRLYPKCDKKSRVKLIFYADSPKRVWIYLPKYKRYLKFRKLRYNNKIFYKGAKNKRGKKPNWKLESNSNDLRKNVTIITNDDEHVFFASNPERNVRPSVYLYKNIHISKKKNIYFDFIPFEN